QRHVLQREARRRGVLGVDAAPGDGDDHDPAAAAEARPRRQSDHDMPMARMAVTQNRPSQEIAAVSIGSQPQLATSQKNAARNALTSSRLRPPIERRVSRRQMTQPISSTT